MPTVCELKKQAKERGLRGYSKLKKAELEKLLSGADKAKKAASESKKPKPKSPPKPAEKPKDEGTGELPPNYQHRKIGKLPEYIFRRKLGKKGDRFEYFRADGTPVNEFGEDIKYGDYKERALDREVNRMDIYTGKVIENYDYDATPKIKNKKKISVVKSKRKGESSTAPTDQELRDFARKLATYQAKLKTMGRTSREAFENSFREKNKKFFDLGESELKKRIKKAME